MAMQPTFLGLSGLAITADERALFTAHPPAGFILFKRNVAGPAQLHALTDSLRALSGRENLPILIDQEGGRVARMQPPHWPEFPNGEIFSQLYDIAPISAIEAARINAQALGLMLQGVGINVDCLPLLDVRQAGAHDVIGDRALGHEPMRVAALGRAQLEGLQRAGCIGVIKHIPGHGRSLCDSHLELPMVKVTAEELEIDLAPFLPNNQAPMAMTAHIIYEAWDAEHCATLSPYVIETIIRKRIGFDGLLMSDDIGMKALQGDFGSLTRDILAAGCDIVLHCSGDLKEMEAVTQAAGSISAQAAARLERALTWPQPCVLDSLEDLMAQRDSLLALVRG
jgi:beta-N-acetylhexosaminidase